MTKFSNSKCAECSFVQIISNNEKYLIYLANIFGENMPYPIEIQKKRYVVAFDGKLRLNQRLFNSLVWLKVG